MFKMKTGYTLLIFSDEVDVGCYLFIFFNIVGIIKIA